MKHILILLMLITVVAGCSTKKRTLSDNCLTCLKPTPDKSQQLSDMMKSVRFIPLETTEQSLIGRSINKIKKINNRYYVSSDRRDLFEYDENGRFIKKIGSIGIGPGEYIELCDFDVSENGTVIINNIKQLIFYDGDGKYQHSVMVDIMPLSIKIVKDNRILIYGSGEEYAIYEIDMSGKIIKKEFKNTYQGLKTGKGIHFLSYGQDKTITQIGFSNDFIFYDFNDKNFSYTKLVCDENILSSAKEEEVWHAYNDDMDKYADVYSNYNTIYRVAGSNSHLYFSQGYYNDDDGNARLYIQVLNIQTGNIEHVISDKDTNDITFAGKPFYFLYRALVTDAQDCFISSVHLDSVWKGLKKNSEFKDSSNYKQLEELFKNKSEKEIEDENPMLVEFVFK